MIYIDTDPRTNTTWRLIAEAGGYQHYQGRANAGDVIVRWGANGGRHSFPPDVRVLNPKLYLSKVDQCDLFEHRNVPIPKVYRRSLIWEVDGRPRLIRKPAIGQMGTGVVLISGSPMFEAGFVHQAYIDKDREFRAMMVGDLLAFFMEKHRPANGDIRWNEHRGSEWSGVPEDRDLRNKVKVIGKQALDAIGYDFGAIDIIKKGDKLYVLEVNSRPEFEQPSAERFVRAIARYLEIAPRRQPRR